MKQRLFQETDPFFHTPNGKNYGTPSPDANPYGYIDHVVKSGETLEELAKKYNVSREEIIKANSGEGGQWGRYDRSKNWLYAGESLKIPIATKAQYDIEAIKKWISEQPKDNTNKTPEKAQKPSATSQKTPAFNGKPLVLDLSKIKHHEEKKFPDIKCDLTVWRGARSIVPMTQDELKNVKVYIFWVNDFRNQTTKLINDLLTEYSSNEIAVGYMVDAHTFATLWEQMQGAPETVVINTHGKNQSITTGEGAGDQQLTATGNGETNISKTKVMDLHDLSRPKANLSGTTLQLNSCHSNDTEPKAHLEGDHHQGDLNGTKRTTAEVFLRRFGFNEVRATKGSVNYTQWFQAWSDEWDIGDPYPKDGTWEFMSLDEDGNIQIREEEVD